MDVAKRHIIQQLRKEILPLEGLKVLPSDLKINMELPSLENAFPNKTFPVGCVHEFVSGKDDDSAATYGFIGFLLSKLMQQGGNVIWVSSRQTVFPNTLKEFGISPEDVVFIQVRDSKDILWTIEEALKCDWFAAVVGEVRHMGFTESRRLQLAAEKSRVTGFIHRPFTKSQNQVACVSRWHVSSLPSEIDKEFPGVGFPRWEIELKKIRNGRPGRWSVEWRPDGIHSLDENVIARPDVYRTKAG